jgi:predicted nuclease of predicted toxin-antitoxin system
MKLLFDQNLSHRLVRLLADAYPDCEHVRNIGLKEAADTVVWEYARKNGYLIVSKDSDFYQRSLLLGSPPKIVWVRLGNCSTQAVVQTLRSRAEEVRRFEEDPTATFLILP